MWKEQNNALYKKFTFKDFQEAVTFINRVADIANDMNHHPRLQNTYNIVEIWLQTHDAGDVVTDKDTQLAAKIDALIGEADTSPAPTTGTVKEVKVYADGGSRGNPGPSASGFVVLDMNDGILYKNGVYLGITTNNQAEYLALKYGLEAAKKMGAEDIQVYMDSLLVINQMKGIFKVKNQDLQPIHAAIKELARHFTKVTYTHVPRELNKLADAAVNEALDAELAK